MYVSSYKTGRGSHIICVAMSKGNIVQNEKLTGLHFSCCGMSSGRGRAGGLGLVSENSFGSVVLGGALLTLLRRQFMTAS